MLAGKTLTKVANQSTKDKAYPLKLIDQESNLSGGVGDDTDDDDNGDDKDNMDEDGDDDDNNDDDDDDDGDLRRRIFKVLLLTLKTHDALCLR